MWLLVGAVAGSVTTGGFAGAPAVRLRCAILHGRSLRRAVQAAIHLAVAAWIAAAFITQFADSNGFRSAAFGRSLSEALLENGFPPMRVDGFAALDGRRFCLLRAPTAAGRREALVGRLRRRGRGRARPRPMVPVRKVQRETTWILQTGRSTA